MNGRELIADCGTTGRDGVDEDLAVSKAPRRVIEVCVEHIGNKTALRNCLSSNYIVRDYSDSQKSNVEVDLIVVDAFGLEKHSHAIASRRSRLSDFGIIPVLAVCLPIDARKITDNLGNLIDEVVYLPIGIREFGNRISRLLAFREITVKLTSALRLAENTVAEKKKFIAIMSHELRTPLNAILGINDHLIKNLTDAAAAQPLRVAQNAARQLSRIAEDLLELSRPPDKKRDLKIVAFSPSSLVHEIAMLFCDQAKYKGLRINTVCDFAGFLLGDKTLISRVICNLVDNAIKFSLAGTITIGFECISSVGKWWDAKIFVVDEGIGVPINDRERIFHEFEQIDSSNTRWFSGSGLGLAIASQLATIMKGEIGVDSNVGKGSTFWVKLSLEMVDTALIDNTFTAACGRVLVVCPESQMSTAIRECLSADHVIFDMRLTVAEAICELQRSVAASNTYDAVVIDADTDLPPEVSFRLYEALAGADFPRVVVVGDPIRPEHLTHLIPHATIRLGTSEVRSHLTRVLGTHKAPDLSLGNVGEIIERVVMDRSGKNDCLNDEVSGIPPETRIEIHRIASLLASNDVSAISEIENLRGFISGFLGSRSGIFLNHVSGFRFDLASQELTFALNAK